MPTVFFNDIFKNCFGAFWFCAVEARLERTPSKSRNGRPTNSQCSVFHAKCCRKTCSRSSHNFDETSSSAEKRSETLRNDGVGNECLWSFWPRGLCWTFECLWSQVQQPEPKQSPSRAQVEKFWKPGFKRQHWTTECQNGFLRCDFLWREPFFPKVHSSLHVADHRIMQESLFPLRSGSNRSMENSKDLGVKVDSKVRSVAKRSKT